MSTKTIHEGHNVKRIREIFGLKQEALALELGNDWTQRKVSLLEAKEQIEPEILEEVAKALKVPVDAIRNFDAQETVYNIQNNYDSANPSINFPQQCTFNPLEKYIEAVDQIQKLNAKNEKLYEALLKEKDEKIALLEKMMNKK